MPGAQVNQTRMELSRQKGRLATAVKGHRLLKDKRDELMREFLDLVRVNMELRRRVEDKIADANRNLALAKCTMSEEVLKEALMAPRQEVYLTSSTRNIMSVNVPVFSVQTRTSDENDIYSYGYAFTSSDLDGSVRMLAEILPDLLKLAEVEKSCQLMAAEIEKTRRRVNALEHVIIPEAQKNIRTIGMHLDESERSTQVRLMKVKDMVIKDARRDKHVA
ncbi:V/A-type H+-transporting ATPase subunit D [Olsenella profusa DSM 13989]|uniref:V-type ATP synthase subunit D n=1 Tax=Olsenella profusa TaxID=138595 RepID=UPI002789B6DE|nr:V-type ATP synthase subunit D [Olsenella profusa]MDP9860171.1 V/A-type H+-transporting ATPase subunit D [Olsenella profusa DSM 13989]